MSDQHRHHPFEDAPIIFRYRRAQAIEDGMLIDLTEWAGETGFRYPVACTATVWNGYIVPQEDLCSFGQSERGRAHDLLWMLRCTIERGRDEDHEFFQCHFLESPCSRITVRFKAVCGPGDDGQPVLTIMLPEED